MMADFRIMLKLFLVHWSMPHASNDTSDNGAFVLHKDTMLIVVSVSSK
jgi:hypothetical protein